MLLYMLKLWPHLGLVPRYRSVATVFKGFTCPIVSTARMTTVDRVSYDVRNNSFVNLLPPMGLMEGAV